MSPFHQITTLDIIINIFDLVGEWKRQEDWHGYTSLKNSFNYWLQHELKTRTFQRKLLQAIFYFKNMFCLNVFFIVKLKKGINDQSLKKTNLFFLKIEKLGLPWLCLILLKAFKKYCFSLNEHLFIHSFTASKNQKAMLEIYKTQLIINFMIRNRNIFYKSYE